MDTPNIARISQYLAIACYTTLLYDYVLTFNRELSLFWKRGYQSLNVVGALFVMARYIPLVVVLLCLADFDAPWYLMYNTSHPITSAIKWLGFYGIAASETILIARTYALWGRKKWVLIGLLLLSMCLGIIYLVIYVTTKDDPYLSRSSIASFAGILAFETVVLVMTLYKRSRQYALSNPLLNVLYRDGIFYFICIFTISLANLITVALDKHLPVQQDVQVVFHSILSTRIILHIREQGESDLGAIQRTPVSTLEFVQAGSRESGVPPRDADRDSAGV